MNFTLKGLLGLLPAVGPVVAALPEFKKLYDLGVGMLHPQDQATAKDAYHDLIANNAEGHARFQQKLAAAEND
jgi:hypothetical protein